MKATSEPRMIVAAAAHISQTDAPVSATNSIPKTYTVIFSTAKTPALTTATACRRALTGVGATMAAGSQR